MKAVLVLCLCIVVQQISAASIRLKRSEDEDDQKIRECKQEWNFGKENVEDIIEHNQTPKNYKAYIHFMECYWTKKGFLDQNGDIDYNRIREMLFDAFYDDSDTAFTVTIVERIMGRCKNIASEAPGEKALLMARCISKELHV